MGSKIKDLYDKKLSQIKKDNDQNKNGNGQEHSSLA